MKLVLNVYTDETLTEVKHEVEAERLKIPYRVAVYIISSLEDVNLKNDEDLIKFIGGSMDKMDKIIKATFGISDSELDCVDGGELVSVIVELYKWGMEKIKTVNRGNDSKNSLETV